MPSPVKRSGASGSTTPSKDESPSNPPVKEEGAKSSEETAQSKDSAQSAVSEATPKPEVVKAVEKSPKSPLEQAAEGGGVSPAPPEIKASEEGVEAESSPDKIKKSVTTEGTEKSEVVGSEEKDVARSSSENPLKSETVSKTDYPPEEEVHSKSPKSSKEGDSAKSLESSEKPEEPEKQEDVSDVPDITVSSAEVKEQPEEESGVVGSSDRSSSQQPAAAVEEGQLEGDRHDGQQARSFEELPQEGSSLQLMESPLIRSLSESTSRDIASGEQERLAANVEPSPAERSSASTAATPELANDLLEGLPYGRGMADLLRERDAALVFGGQFSQRLAITAPDHIVIRIEPKIGILGSRFNILIDVSRYESENIDIHLVGNKIEVYARQENENDYGEEENEFHQIFDIPEIVDASRFSACITSESNLFIQAPLRITSEN